MDNKRIFHDPIHKEIIIDSDKPEELMIMELIDTAAFQRLRRIKQLGAASLLFMARNLVDLRIQLVYFALQEKFIED